MNHFICALSKPVNFLSNSLLDGFIKFFKRLFGVGQKCYFIHNSFFRDPQLLPLPKMSSRLALRIFFINSGFCDRSQSSRSSLVFAVSKTLRGKVTSSDFIFVNGISFLLFLLYDIINYMKRKYVLRSRL